MAWGIFKKIKNAFKKASNWVKDKVINPVVNTAKKIINNDTTKKLINTGVRLAPALGTGIGASQGNPQAGMAAGTAIQTIGKSLGYG